MSGSFFDFHERVTKKTAKPQSPTTPSDDSGPLTVSQLTAKIDRVLKSGLPASVLVMRVSFGTWTRSLST